MRLRLFSSSFPGTINAAAGSEERSGSSPNPITTFEPWYNTIVSSPRDSGVLGSVICLAVGADPALSIVMFDI
ncbi:MAG: hypothetical protein ABFD49_11880 [Armatimonadota bacterium]|nr:hypothetical protein [bacterium]